LKPGVEPGTGLAPFGQVQAAPPIDEAKGSAVAAKVLERKDSSIVLSAETAANVKSGDQLEVYVASPNGGARRVVAKGKVTAVGGSLIIGTIDGEPAAVASGMSARIVPAANQPADAKAAEAKNVASKKAVGKLSQIHGSSVVIETTGKPTEGSEFEVVADEPGKGEKVIARGKIEAVDGGRVIGNIESKSAPLAAKQSVRISLYAPSTPPAAEPLPETKSSELAIDKVKGATLLLTVDEDKKIDVGDKFEVITDLPEGGVAVLGAGKVVSVVDGIVVAKVENSSARISTRHRVRMTEKAPAPYPGTAETKPSPVPPNSEETLQSFDKVVKRHRHSVALVKDSESTAHGTAFVISKKHRLLATNAHVADIADHVVLNESRTIYKVARKWYHPDTIRIMSYDNRTAMKSIDPKVGKVDPTGTDLAILELEGVGPDLPSEMTLARPDAAKQITAVTVGMYGYPAYDTKATAAQLARATFVEGVVSRMQRLNGFLENVAEDELRGVCFTAPSYPGFSGSPVFLPDGKVVVIHNSIITPKDGQRISFGTRVDALWDLLTSLKMLDKLPGSPTSPGEPLFIQNQSPNALKLQEAFKLAVEAIQMQRAGKLDEAMAKINRSIELSPQWWEAYQIKGKIIDDYAEKHLDKLTVEMRDRMYNNSLAFIRKADELHHQSFNIRNLGVVLDLARQSINVGRFTNDEKTLRDAATLISREDVQRLALQGPQAAYYLALRATLKKDLKDLEGSLTDISEAVKRNPNNVRYRRERADVLQKLGRDAEAAEELRTVDNLNLQ
jgi:S1-C subfamily serine protease